VTRRPSFKEGDHKNIVATTVADAYAATTLPPASLRSNAPQAIDLEHIYVLPLVGIIAAKRGVPPEDKDAIVARPRRTTAEKLRVVADGAREPAVPASSKPDPRLVNLVQLLARAAQDFVQPETDSRTRDRLPE
jgi:hypothetical protein